MTILRNILPVTKKFFRFLGPGLMVSVAYMDPGNYSTAVAAGSAYKYNLLFSILLSNCLAVFLQVLSAKLGAVTGLDLAANCRSNLSPKLNLIIYILAEIAIIATDLAEVVGTAIALNILFNLPLFAGVIVTVVDVLVVLMAYRPKGPLLFVRVFEGFVSVLVGATVICFAIELFQVSKDSTLNFSFLEALKGFLPNDDVVDTSDREGGNGLFLSLAILGATVMPHSLYLGSGLVQARLKDFDIKHGHYVLPEEDDDADSSKDDEDDEEPYRPSIHAIDDTMTYTIAELVISLFTVALFVNSAILIVAGATLEDTKKNDHFHFLRDDDDHDSSDNDSDDDDIGNADLFTIYHLLSNHLSPTAGFVFALALLCSGQSAGVVCTLAGQMVSEGFLSWSFPPVIRRLITRGLAILPCLLVVSFAGREGLSRILNASQVVLSILLPFVSAPLIVFTCSKSIMRVPIYLRDGDEDADTFIEDDSVLSSAVTANDSIAQIPSNITLDGTRKKRKTKLKKYQTSEAAIRLQNLRNSHPCVGWEDEESEHEQHGLLKSTNYTPTEHPSAANLSSNASDADVEDGVSDFEFSNDNEDDIYRVKGYKDMSNGPITSLFAILVWGFVACLNLFLIGSMLLGYDVPL